jgi:hypothetical protein
MAKAKRAGGTPVEALAVKVVVRPVEHLETFYINYAEVGHSPHEFYILGGKLPIKPSRAEIEAAAETKELQIDATVQLMLPPTMISGLIRALTEQRAKYEKMIGPITDTSKAQGLDKETQ